MSSQVYGRTSQEWEAIRTVFEQNFRDQLDIGASLCIFHQGKCVVDLYGGYKDIKTNSEPYTADTLQLVYSTSKGIMAAAIAICVDRGWLNYDLPVAKYWPEFGENEKQNITVAQLLSHRAGISYVDEDLTMDDVLDWSRMASLIASQKPHWEPGTAHGYHAHTIGYAAGELIRCVDPLRRSYGQFVRDELDSEFYCGIPDERVETRVAPLICRKVDMSDMPLTDSLTDRSWTCSGALLLGCSKMIFNDIRLHRAELPAVNGITNARSLARVYARLIGNIEENGYLKKPLLTTYTLNEAIRDVTPPGEPDINWYHLPSTFSKSGFQTFGPCFNIMGDGVFGHSGFGGSCAFAYPAEKLAYAYVCNYLDQSALMIDPRSIRVIETIKTILSQKNN